MMTLDGAIKHCEEVAEEQDKLCKVNDSFNFAQPKWEECAAEHRQLAEWLKELKQLRQLEHCEKAVSKQDCINAIENTDCELSPQAWKEITNNIMSLPPVMPTRKKGKWIFFKTIFDKHGYTVECSSCHKKWKTYDEIRWRKENKYCSNCGSRNEV